MNNLTCKKCKHYWVSRIENPRQCPKCKNDYWDKPRIKEMIKVLK